MTLTVWAFFPTSGFLGRLCDNSAPHIVGGSSSTHDIALVGMFLYGLATGIDLVVSGAHYCGEVHKVGVRRLKAAY